MKAPLRFGVFITPFHPTGQSPTVALQYDMERVVALDRLGYDEAWFGEHHSGGYELIACPEVFIAAAAERTTHIRLGTGVVSLPYHHPLMVADRWVLLDHLTRGRVMFGTGPGALPSDAYMMGIDPVEQRRMMQESLEAILALFRAAPDERIDRHSDWFTLREAQLHIRPYTWPYPEIATAAMISPSGPRLAGALGTSLLSLSMSVPGGYAALETAWGVVREQAAKAGRGEPDRADWRVLSIMHLSDSRDQAIDDCTYGLPDFSRYFGAAGFVPLANTVEGTQSSREFVEQYAAKGNCCIGTPDDAIAHIEDLLHRSGGFGTLLLLGHDWAPPPATFHSYELFARAVIPYFKGQLAAPRASHEWARGKRDQLIGAPPPPPPADAVELRVLNDGVFVGSSVAPTTIDIFNEPICPPCGSFIRSYASDIDTAVADKQLAVRYHLLNFLDDQSHSKNYSTRAVAASYCVAGQNDPKLYASFYSALFGSDFQPQENAASDRTDAELAHLAQTVGAEPTAISCIKSGADLGTAQTKATNASETLAGFNASGTPFVWDGSMVVNYQDPSWLARLIG